jgi:hypothetical protein
LDKPGGRFGFQRRKNYLSLPERQAKNIEEQLVGSLAIGGAKVIQMISDGLHREKGFTA